MPEAVSGGTAKLVLGPLLFNWPAEEARDFYLRIADEADLNRVTLGEVVCSKRAPFFERFVPEVAERPERAGKEVVHATLALVMSAREIDALRGLAADADLLVEANDLSAAALLTGRAHVIGPFVNVYNEGSLATLRGRGAVRLVPPAELPAGALAALARDAGGVELEVQVFGRLPLAISARCYHARAHGLHKDACRYVCAEDPDGLDLETLDGEAFLAVNGTQSLSHATCNLLGELDALRAMGVASFRLWPHAIDMVAVAELFRGVLRGREEPAAASARLGQLMPGAAFCNGFYHGREGAVYVPPEPR